MRLHSPLFKAELIPEPGLGLDGPKLEVELGVRNISVRDYGAAADDERGGATSGCPVSKPRYQYPQFQEIEPPFCSDGSLGPVIPD